MLVQRQKFLASYSVPNSACSVIRPSDELVSGLVEGTVGQGKEMSTKNLEAAELLLLVLELLLNQLFNQFLQLTLP